MTYDFHVSTESVTGYNSPLFTKDNLNIVRKNKYLIKFIYF